MYSTDYTSVKEEMMFILPRLEVPEVPLTYTNDKLNLDAVLNYLQSLVGYFYNCNAPILEQDQILTGSTGVGTTTAYWPEGVITNIIFHVNISSAYTGGNLTFKINRRGTVTGTAIMAYHAYRFRDNAAFVTLATAVAINFTPADVNNHITTVTLTSPNIQAGDTIRLDISRDGTHAGDTMTSNVENDGISFTLG
jgi:hypothetical protein